MMDYPLMVKRTKISMFHPYGNKKSGINSKKKIEVEVHGEYFNDLPHGLCFMYYRHNIELQQPGDSSSPSDSYLDGNCLSFKGLGLFLNGVLTDGPAFFLKGCGGSLSCSWMHHGRPAYMSQLRYYHKQG